MARYQYVVLSRALPGRQDEFETWYDKHHFADLLKIPEIVSGSRSRVLMRHAPDFGEPQWCSLAIYEIEAENPGEVLARIETLANTDEMPISEALDQTGIVQLLCAQVQDVAKATPQESAT